ncbi:hypothetical protein HRG_012070 [Hirsutella rhossiliensis]
MVCNTTVTFTMLGSLTKQVRSHGGDDMFLLDSMRPLAESLYRSDICNARDVEILLEEVRRLKSTAGTT